MTIPTLALPFIVPRKSAPSLTRVKERAPHNIAATYFMGVEFAYYDIHVSVDITDQMVKRIAGEKMFETLGHTEEFARKRLEIGAGHWGWHARVASPEPFVRARRTVQTHLTVSEHDLRAATKPRRRGGSACSRASWTTDDAVSVSLPPVV